MKTKMSLTKKISMLISIGLLFSLSSSGQKMEFHNTGVAPAAEAHVKIHHDKNKNYAIKLKIFNLAPASDLNPPKKTYVAWMETDHDGLKNIGDFRSKSELLSKAFKGSIETVSAFKPTRFFITAENDGSVSEPGPVVILKTK